MKSAALLLSFLLVPIRGVPAGAAAGPDIVPSGMHGCRFSMTVDPGAFAANLCRRYTVVEGDTLEGTAKRECGDVACVEEIAYRLGWIGAADVRRVAAAMNNRYGDYLVRVLETES